MSVKFRKKRKRRRKENIPKFTTNSGLLEPTKRHLIGEKVVAINPDRPSLKSVADFNRSIQILSVNTRSKPIKRIMSLCENILNILEFSDSDNRSENFFLHNLHFLVDTSENSGLNEISFLAVTFTAEYNFGAFVFAGFDVIHDTRELEF